MYTCNVHLIFRYEKYIFNFIIKPDAYKKYEYNITVPHIISTPYQEINTSEKKYLFNINHICLYDFKTLYIDITMKNQNEKFVSTGYSSLIDGGYSIRQIISSFKNLFNTEKIKLKFLTRYVTKHSSPTSYTEIQEYYYTIPFNLPSLEYINNKKINDINKHMLKSFNEEIFHQLKDFKFNIIRPYYMNVGMDIVSC